MSKDFTLIHDSLELFRGTAGDNEKVLFTSEETTIGDGLYLTTERKVAEEYARQRAKNGGKPFVSTFNYGKLRLADMRTLEGARSFIEPFAKNYRQLVKEYLAEKKKNPSWGVQEAHERNAERLSLGLGNKGVASLKSVLSVCGAIFSKFLAAQGYDGIIANEGGEGKWSKEHESVVVFEPKNNLIGVCTEPVNTREISN